MRSKKIDNLFFPLDNVEKIQLKTGKNFNDISLDFRDSIPPKVPSKIYFKDNNIFINKHHRFSYMPAHTHDFVEINYMYSGNCTQYINNETVELNTGNIILMDRDIVQSIDYIGEKDILINILIKDDSILSKVLTGISHSSSLVTRFMVNAAKMNAIHNNFILFDASKNEVALNLINSLIICGAKNDGIHSNEMNQLLSILLIELSRSIETETHHFSKGEDTIVQILQFIDQNFKYITLNKLSKEFGYNKNYLSNKIKKETGETFQELIDNKRMNLAKKLLLETTYSVSKIAEEVGYSNDASLFKLFIKSIRITPSEYRLKFSIY